jgi:multidrug resistance efflux pump
LTPSSRSTQLQVRADQVIASVDADKEAVDTVQPNLDYASIVAPSDGSMGVHLIDPGNIIVHASDSMSISTLTLTGRRPCTHAVGQFAR